MELQKGEMSITLRLSDEDALLIRSYAKINGISVSELARKAVIKKVEDEINIEHAKKALAEYEADPVTYTHDEVGRMLGLK